MHLADGWYEVKLELERVLNSLFGRGRRISYTEFDSVLSLAELESLGYARNFPHLTCLMCSVPTSLRPLLSKGARSLSRDVRPDGIDLALLPAACYKIYIHHRDARLSSEKTLGCIARCFRSEDKPLDSYRGFNFTMKEFVHLGGPDGARAHLESGFALIGGLLTDLGIAYTCETATDPFFDMSSSTAVLSQLSPTKRELLFNGHAVSSLNYHRNYFGEKFGITLGGETVHSSCVAFGIERWIAMLDERFGNAAAALEALKAHA